MTPRVIATAHWRRLDADGEDMCSLLAEGTGWRLSGLATFDDGGRPARLAYDVHAGSGWITSAATINGELAGQQVALAILRDARGRWTLNGVACPSLDGLFDIDLFFTPATNTLPIRRHHQSCGPETAIRADLTPGQPFATTAVWLTPALTLAPLPQVYVCDTALTCRYTSPSSGFSARLTLHHSGLVTDYPPFWRGEVRDA